MGETGIGDLARRGEDTERDGQIETAGLLGQIGRRQIHRNTFGGEFKSGVVQGGADPVACLLDFGIRQADQRDAR